MRQSLGKPPISQIAKHILRSGFNNLRNACVANDLRLLDAFDNSYLTLSKSPVAGM